jgi:hypothetical protein
VERAHVLVPEAVREVQLRVSLVWRDEVMADVVLPRPRPVTLGASPKCTFVVPELGLPPRFAIVKPDNRGYLLTLGPRMRGTIQVDGASRDVEEFVQRRGEGEAATSFRATPIGGRDWGLIDLDESGDYRLFFQFVPVEAPLPRLRLGRYREVAAIGAAVLAAVAAFPTYATVILVGTMLGTAVFELALGVLFAEEDDYTRPAIAFSILLFAILLAAARTFAVDEQRGVPPGPRELTAGYLIDRLEGPIHREPEPEPEPTAAAEPAAPAAPDEPTAETPRRPAARQGEAGRAGGAGAARAAAPDADEGPPAPPDKGLFTGANRAQLGRVTAAPLDLSRYTGMTRGPRQEGDAGRGRGTGSGVGDDLAGTGTRRGAKGTGRGGGGAAEGDFVAQGQVDVGETRAPRGRGGTGSGVKEAQVAFAKAEGDFTGGLSREEVERVVRSRKGTIHACYQRAVNRDRSLAGKLVVNFRIGADGKVASVRIEPGKSSLRSAEVESCIKRQIQGLQFPAKGGAIVNYPFIFTPGGA